MKSLPKISIITPTLNNESTLPELLKSIELQNYPKDKIEIVITDGGSKDKTLQIAKKYKAKIFPNKKILAEPGVDLGLSKATGDIMMILATDNIYKDKNAFKIIAKVFENPEIYAAFPKHNSDKSDTIFSKYINTFTDPFNHFIYGNASNARTFHRIYKIIKSTETYNIYDYKSATIKPMIAFAQGFAIRKGYKRDKKDALDDLGPVIELIKMKKKIAYIFSLSLYHHTIRDLDHFIRKQKWATQNAISHKKYGISHRQNILSSEQKVKIKIWPIYALTFIGPFIYSIIGFFKTKEKIWFFHPVICFLSAYASLSEVVMYNIHKSTKISRQ